MGGSYRSAMGGIIKRHMDAGEFVDMMSLEGIHKHSSDHLGVMMAVVARWRIGVELLLGVGAMVKRGAIMGQSRLGWCCPGSSSRRCCCDLVVLSCVEPSRRLHPSRMLKACEAWKSLYIGYGKLPRQQGRRKLMTRVTRARSWRRVMAPHILQLSPAPPLSKNLLERTDGVESLVRCAKVAALRRAVT